jgi:hypothetical protein
VKTGIALARTRRRRFGGISRPRYIVPGDTRDAMRRLLEDCNCNGRIEPNYEQQFRTLFKAERLGYLDDQHRLTDKGIAFLTAG